MISYPEARRFSPNEARDKARKALADSLREMRRRAYDQPEEVRFIGHQIARNAFNHYRARSMYLNRLILAEALRHGEKVH